MFVDFPGTDEGVDFGARDLSCSSVTVPTFIDKEDDETRVTENQTRGAIIVAWQSGYSTPQDRTTDTSTDVPGACLSTNTRRVCQQLSPEEEKPRLWNAGGVNRYEPPRTRQPGGGDIGQLPRTNVALSQ